MMNINTQNTVFCLMGPTATGKTDCAILLAKKFPIEIVSVDSAMVYKTMDIGTGKPTADELKIIPHHLINLIDPAESYSAGQFCIDAKQKIQEIFSRNNIPLLVSGTMLYFHQLLYGLAELPTANYSIRKKLHQEIQDVGLKQLYEKLEKIDPISASKIKPQDSQRIQRALEVYLLTGKPISDFYKQNQNLFLQNYHVKTIALIPNDRALLHCHIEKRFQKMLAMGLIDEVKALHDRKDLNPGMTATRMIGYRQIWEYLDGVFDLERMHQKVLAATRQLAKRQLTWLRNWDNLITLDPFTSDIQSLSRHLKDTMNMF